MVFRIFYGYHVTATSELRNYSFHFEYQRHVKIKLSVCFVYAGEDIRVKGYYTLSNASIKRELLPEAVKKKMPPAYNDLPATLLGRLAVDNRFKGKKLGSFLLLDALKKSYEVAGKVGSVAIIVDPLDEDAEKFYDSFGFIKLADSGKMFMMMVTVADLFK